MVNHIFIIRIGIYFTICKVVRSNSDVPDKVVLRAKNKYFSIEEFKSVITKNKFTCFIHCHHEEQCVAINTHYIQENKISCLLLDQKATIPFDLIPADQYNYYEIVRCPDLAFKPQRSVMRDCLDWKDAGFNDDGWYYININDVGNVIVFCDMVSDGGGWTVFQKRFDGSVPFHDMLWDNYKNGFGSACGEFWLGNDNIHKLTNLNISELRIEAETFSGVKQSSTYTQFSLSDENSNYTIHYGSCVSYYCGAMPNNLQFTTPDKDHDTNPSGNCAVNYQHSNWHSACYNIGFNGKYQHTEQNEYARGIIWNGWTGYDVSLKKSAMMLRRI